MISPGKDSIEEVLKSPRVREIKEVSIMSYSGRTEVLKVQSHQQQLIQTSENEYSKQSQKTYQILVSNLRFRFSFASKDQNVYSLGQLLKEEKCLNNLTKGQIINLFLQILTTLSALDIENLPEEQLFLAPDQILISGDFGKNLKEANNKNTSYSLKEAYQCYQMNQTHKLHQNASENTKSKEKCLIFSLIKIFDQVCKGANVHSCLENCSSLSSLDEFKEKLMKKSKKPYSGNSNKKEKEEINSRVFLKAIEEMNSVKDNNKLMKINMEYLDHLKVYKEMEAQNKIIQNKQKLLTKSLAQQNRVIKEFEDSLTNVEDLNSQINNIEKKEMPNIDQELVSVIDDIKDIKQNILEMENERQGKTSEIQNIEKLISELKVNVEEKMKRNIQIQDEQLRKMKTVQEEICSLKQTCKEKNTKNSALCKVIQRSEGDIQMISQEIESKTLSYKNEISQKLSKYTEDHKQLEEKLEEQQIYLQFLKKETSYQKEAVKEEREKNLVERDEQLASISYQQRFWLTKKFMRKHGEENAKLLNKLCSFLIFMIFICQIGLGTSIIWVQSPPQNMLRNQIMKILNECWSVCLFALFPDEL